MDSDPSNRRLISREDDGGKNEFWVGVYPYTIWGPG
jgi:hypothetical protein